MKESPFDELKENPSLLLRIIRESLKVALHDETFRKELITSLSTLLAPHIIEPLYDKELAIRLVPCSLPQFERLVRENTIGLSPPHYRLVGHARRRHRLFYASDIEKLRKALHAPYRKDTKVAFASSSKRQAACRE